jgi:hypothetical protein
MINSAPTDDLLDEKDVVVLCTNILRQAIDDYSKLAHPNQRKKKYLEEAYQNAVNMFFDQTYRLIAFKNENDQDMSLEDFVKTILESDRVDLDKLRKHVVDQAIEYWNTKEVNTLIIPSSVYINGHVYQTSHSEDDTYQVDYDEKTIYLNRDDSNSENQEMFVKAVHEIICYHEEIVISKQQRDILARGWFRTLRLNNCFVGD